MVDVCVRVCVGVSVSVSVSAVTLLGTPPTLSLNSHPIPSPQLMVRTMLVDGVRQQMEAFRQGFNAVFSLDTLRIFSLHEVRGRETE
jgi:hypothetical protein